MLKISKSGLRMTYPKSALSELKIIMSLLMRLDICLFCLFLSRSIPLLCGTRRSGSANSNHTGSVPGRINSTKSPGAIGRWIVWIFGYLDYAFVGSIPCKIFQNPATLLNWGLWKKQTNIMQVGSNQTSLRNFSTKVFSLWILEQKIQFYYFSRPTTHQLISLSKFTDQCQISPILSYPPQNRLFERAWNMQANKSYFGQKYPNFIQTWPTENVSTYCMISRNPAIFQYTHPFIPHSGES